MKPAPFFYLSLFTLLTLMAAGTADAVVTVNLKNGNPLSADSYHIEKNKIFLKYPLGEVEIPLSQVESIKTDGGEPILFHEEGRRTEKTQQADPARPKSLMPMGFKKPAGRHASRHRPSMEERKKWLEEHPEARQRPSLPQTEAEKKADAVMDRYFAAPPEEQEKMEAELERTINQLFNEE